MSAWITFVAWCAARGLQDVPLTLDERGARGLTATRPLESGDTLIAVPDALLITGAKVRSRFNGIESAHALLALFLCKETRLGESSLYWPFIRLLPEVFSVAVCLKEDLWPWMPAKVQDHVTEMRNKMDSEYKEAQKVWGQSEGDGSSLVYRDFVWAWLCVNTRCIYLDTDGKGKRDDNIALAPFLDFLNHSSRAQVRAAYNHKQRAYVITTDTPYTVGQEVFIRYGNHSNAFLLAEYGFVERDNPFNTVNLDHAFATMRVDGESDEERQAKLDYLATHGYLNDYDIVVGDYNYRLLCALRLRCLPCPQLPLESNASVAKWHQVIYEGKEMVSIENERAMHKALVSLLQNALAEARRKKQHLAQLDTNAQQARESILQVWSETIDILTRSLADIENNEVMV